MEECQLCERDIHKLAKPCHYCNCPYRKKGKLLMPVKADRPPVERTLWTLPQDSTTSNAHRPFMDMFTRVAPLKEDSIIHGDDVVFFDGGTDIDPTLYGETPHIMTGRPDKERDQREKAAFLRAQGAGARCLGVCRGAQFLCVMSGGKLVQHVTGHNHSAGHLILTDSNFTMFTESSHHQMMWPNQIPHVLIAWANLSSGYKMSDEFGKELEDGRMPEIIYCKNTKCLCIQGHTEWVDKDSPFAQFTRRLVKEFIIEGV
jgi:anthranilate/para-aminobenzoate synthase component II